MPYKMTKIRGGYRVKNTTTGRITARKTTKSKAQRQLRLLRLIDRRQNKK